MAEVAEKQCSSVYFCGSKKTKQTNPAKQNNPPPLAGTKQSPAMSLRLRFCATCTIQ